MGDARRARHVLTHFVSVAALKVYWQPGCSSCLKAKEFLRKQEIRFESVNVLESKGARAELIALGARSVPVVARGKEFVAAQNLDELAAFVGVQLDRVRLGEKALHDKLQGLMQHVLSQLDCMPESAAGAQLRPDRTLLDLSYHVFAVVLGFLEAARGGRLDEAFFYRTAPMGSTPADVGEEGATVAKNLRAWFREYEEHRTNAPLRTYYGPQNLRDLLERTCWHVAQHVRQIDQALAELNVVGASRVAPELLRGLPLPDHVWDDENSMNVAT